MAHSFLFGQPDIAIIAGPPYLFSYAVLFVVKFDMKPENDR